MYPAGFFCYTDICQVRFYRYIVVQDNFIYVLKFCNLHGDQTTANMTVSDDGTYTIEYPDENGETREISGGGIAYEADGTERPLTGEELLEEANSPDVEYNDDGTVWLYYKNQKIEITDKFKDDVCYVKVQDGDETLYVTVKYQNGLAYSNEKYVEEDEFN